MQVLSTNPCHTNRLVSALTQSPKSRHFGRMKAFVLLVVLIVAILGIDWAYYSFYVQPPNPKQVTTSTQTFNESSFLSQVLNLYHVTGVKVCMVQNATVGGNLSYLITIDIATNLHTQPDYKGATVTIDGFILSKTGPMATTFRMFAPPVLAIHGSSLSVSIYIPVNATGLGYPDDKIIGVALHANVIVQAYGSIDPYMVNPELSLGLTEGAVGTCTYPSF